MKGTRLLLFHMAMPLEVERRGSRRSYFFFVVVVIIQHALWFQSIWRSCHYFQIYWCKCQKTSKISNP